MDIRGMHYDFKQKLNKIDSQQYINLRVPEIDWKLNEAVELFIKSIAQPRVSNYLGFEVSQRSIDDIKTIVIENYEITPTPTQGVSPNTEVIIELPENYMFFVSARALIKKEPCGERIAVVRPMRHNETFEESPFDSSSYEWRTVNIRFFEGGLKAFTDGTFTIEKLYLNYIRKPKYIHNAQDFLPSQAYKLPNGTLLSGTQDCELPEHTHREIVDIAVLITTGDLQIPDYQIKQAKLNLNQIN